MSLWGVGPRIVLNGLVVRRRRRAGRSVVARGLLDPSDPLPGVRDDGVLLLLIGMPMLAVAGRAIAVAYRSDKLATTGIFGVVRNPIYSAWIVFIIPGLVLLTRSWPLFLTPLVAYAVFKATIRRESEYLEQRFGNGVSAVQGRGARVDPFSPAEVRMAATSSPRSRAAWRRTAARRWRFPGPVFLRETRGTACRDWRNWRR